MKVTYYQRRPTSAQHSIERVFDDIRGSLPETIRFRVITCRYNRGILGRLCDAIAAAFRQGDINHITGDVHYLAPLLKRRRTVLTVHDCVSLHRLSGWRRAIFKFFWYDLPVARCGAVVSVSQSAADELASLIPRAAGKIRIIHNPVSRDFSYSPKVFNSKCPRILHLGVQPNKNLPRLIQALSGIPCHLEVIGKLPGDMIAALQRCSIHYSCASGLTNAEVVQKYRDCDLVAFVSTYEGFGLPIIEAHATGRAVVTSNIGSMKEIAGDAAILVDPLDVESIRAGILDVIEGEEIRKLLVQRGLENAKQFKPEVIAARYASIYEELAAQ